MSNFSAEDLQIDPELVSAARRRRKREPFVMLTKAQSDKLDRLTYFTAERVFRHLLFLGFKARGRPVRLGNIILARKGVGRNAKLRALRELEGLGLISVARAPHKSPEVTVLE